MPEKKNTFRKFLVSRVFLKNLALAVGITIIILIIVQLGLRIYTDHGREITVPDFSGLSLVEADRMAVLCWNNTLQQVPGLKRTGRFFL